MSDCRFGVSPVNYPDPDPDGRGFNPHVRQNILSLGFGHEKNSTTILSLPLIQEGQLSVTGERMGTKYW